MRILTRLLNPDNLLEVGSGQDDRSTHNNPPLCIHSIASPQHDIRHTPRGALVPSAHLQRNRGVVIPEVYQNQLAQ